MTSKRIKQPRAPRRRAYFHIEVRRFRKLPFFRADVGLLDISTEGVKVQFHKNIDPNVGSQFWLVIPLSSLNEQRGDLTIKAKVAWFNDDELTVGATFLAITAQEKAAIETLIEELRQGGKLAC